MDYIEQYKLLVNGFKLITMFGMIAVDFILGIVMALYQKKFNWTCITDFLNTSVLGLVAGYYLVGVFALFEPTYSLAVPATWLIIEAKLVNDIVIKLKELGVTVFAK